MRKLTRNTTKDVLLACTLALALLQTACTQENASLSGQQSSSKMQVTYVDAVGAQSLLASKPEAVVLDIRTAKEIAEGYIEGAVFANYNDDDFAQQLSKLDRNTPYVIHCKGGGRSTKALTTLADLGFTNIAHMDGGLDDWKRENLPLLTP